MTEKRAAPGEPGNGAEGSPAPKRSLWNFKAPVLASPPAPATFQEPPSFVVEPPSLAVELHRAVLVRQLRKTYAEACEQIMGFKQPPADSVDRWMLEQLAQPRSLDADPLLPHPHIGTVSRVLLRELLAEVPLRVKKRRGQHLNGTLARKQIEEYCDNADAWMKRLCPSPPATPAAASGADERRKNLAGDIVDLRAWLAKNQTPKHGRAPAPDSCIFRKKLDELTAEEVGISARLRQEAEPSALEVIKVVGDEAERVVTELRALSRAPTPEADGVSVQSGHDAMIVRYAKDELPVSELHYRKLRELYEVHNPRPPDDERQAYDDAFHRRLYLLLRRYVTFIGLDPASEEGGAQGGNMHAAAPETVFSWLHEKLGVGCEVFASPLNCYFQTYFSAFPDVDAVFGSRGSFFDAGLLPSGSYEVGPPYTEEVMELTARRLLEQLQKAPHGHALSFVVFVPDWPGAGALELLDGPDFKDFRRTQHGGTFVLAEGNKHQYVIGVQFFAGTTDELRHYTVPHGTRIYVLQNVAGAEAWPFTEGLERELLAQLRPKADDRPQGEGRGGGVARARGRGRGNGR